MLHIRVVPILNDFLILILCCVNVLFAFVFPKRFSNVRVPDNPIVGGGPRKRFFFSLTNVKQMTYKCTGGKFLWFFIVQHQRSYFS
jgi:hypothetical protein